MGATTPDHAGFLDGGSFDEDKPPLSAIDPAPELAPGPSLIIHENIAYVQGEPAVQRGYTKQCLDVYFCELPEEALPRPRPVVIHFHGGGWRRGDRSIPWFGSPSLCQNFAEHGGAVAVA